LNNDQRELLRRVLLGTIITVAMLVFIAYGLPLFM
jgi:hypothetical protein